LLQNLPDTVERAQKELTLRLVLGAPLVASKGQAAPEVERFYLRMQELCRQVGETPQLFPAVWGLRAFYTVRGELATAYKLGVQLLNIAQNVREPAFLLEAHLGLGIICGWRGELASARAHLEQAVSLYDPQQHSSLAFRYGYNPGALSHGFTALVLWMLGYPDQALRQIEEALVLAQESSHPFSHCYVLMQAIVIHMRRREVDIAQERVEAAFTLANERGFAHFLAGGNLCRGWVLAEQGQYENGILQIRQGIVALQATGAGVEIPGALCFLAQAYAEAGQPEEGLQVLSEALTVLNKNGDHVEEAEWHQLKGELTLQSQVESHKSKVEEAEACFLKAIEVSQKHQTKSWELRATMSLVRLWQQQGKHHEAHEKLAAIYNWFTEGFDTKDLQEAKGLLEGLR